MFDDKFFQDFDKHEKRAFKLFGAFAFVMLLFYGVILAGLIALAVVLLQHFNII